MAKEDLPVLTNIKLHLQVSAPDQLNSSQTVAIEGEIYAKVLKHHQPDDATSDKLELENNLTISAISQQRSHPIKQIYLHFTTVPNDLKAWINWQTSIQN